MSVTCIPQFATHLDAELCSVAQHLQARPLITGPKGIMTVVVAVTLAVCLVCNCLSSVKVDTRYRRQVLPECLLTAMQAIKALQCMLT